MSKACIGCGFQLSPDFAYCPRCGAQSPPACPACGAASDPSFAFCPRCGEALGAASRHASPRQDTGGTPSEPARANPAAEPDPATEANRRQVTLLFADVSGFTALSERLDPEEVRSFQNDLFETFAQVIARYDGFVEKFVGDAVLAVFGAPVAHEDDPERALDAALALTTRMQTLSRRWAARIGRDVELHMAVHTGPVVAGRLGTGAGAGYAVTGDTVNTTARLLAAASSSILVSRTTFERTRHRFAFDGGREITMRGKALPLVAHPLLGVLAEAGSPRPERAPIIGREEELARLGAAFERALRGQAEVVSLVGEAGIGKSRLVDEFLRRLESERPDQPVAVRRTPCSSLGEPTYGTFAALLREGYHVGAGDRIDVAREKLAQGLRDMGAQDDVSHLVSSVLSFLLGLDDARQPEIDPEQLKRQIALAGRTLVELRLREGPLLLVIEDLQWADTASLDLLGDIIDRLRDRSLMVILSHRPDYRVPLAGHLSHSVIRMRPLSAGETRNLLAALFGGPAGEPLHAVEELVVGRAGGNPLFVEEIARSLVEKGVLVRAGEGWTCPEQDGSADVPATLQGLLLSRVDKLPGEPRRVLQEAAVLGVTFDRALLGIFAKDPRRLDASLERLVEADLIQQAGDGPDGPSFRFRHDLLHTVVYENLLLAKRTELHERAGEALIRSVGQTPERLRDIEALGHHWSLGGDRRRGARYLLMAGDWARALYANEDAIRHYDRALRALAEHDDCVEEAEGAREKLADVRAIIGQRTDALRLYEQARDRQEQRGTRPATARLSRKIGCLKWDMGDRQAATAFFEDGLGVLGTDGFSVERAQLLQEMGRLAFRSGDNEAAIAWAERALAELGGIDGADADEEREAAATRVHACNTLGVALARVDRRDDAVRQIEQSIELAERNDLPQAACRGFANLGVLYSNLEPRRSIEMCLKGLETAKKIGDLELASRLYANLAVSYCALTDRCEADGVQAARRSIDLDRRLGLLDHLAVPLIVIGQIHQCRGELEQAFASYHEALGLAEKAGEPQLLFPCYDGLATLHLEAGERDAAQSYFEKSADVCRRVGVEPEALMLLPFLS